MAMLGSEDECLMFKVVHETQYLDKMTWSLLFGKMNYGYWNSGRVSKLDPLGKR